MRNPLEFQESRVYCQGARCGHIDGKDRAGSYVLGEEIEAAENNSLYFDYTDNLWEAGYRYGYCLAAEGKPLPESIQNMDPPIQEFPVY